MLYLTYPLARTESGATVGSAFVGQTPNRHWSLLELMHNFQIRALLALIDALRGYEAVAVSIFGTYEITKAVAAQKGEHISPFSYISSTEREGIDGWLKAAVRIGDAFQDQAIINRVDSFNNQLSATKVTHMEFKAQLTALRESIEDAAKFKCFYLYPPEKIRRVLAIPAEWAAAISSFPSTKKDIEQGVDCFATDHSTASVFHMMRILERGLRRFAKSLKIKWDAQQWGKIIDLIESTISAQQKGGKVFYSGK